MMRTDGAAGERGSTLPETGKMQVASTPPQAAPSQASGDVPPHWLWREGAPSAVGRSRVPVAISKS